MEVCRRWLLVVANLLFPNTNLGRLLDAFPRPSKATHDASCDCPPRVGNMMYSGLIALTISLALCRSLPAADVDSAKLTPQLLRTSLKLGTQFLINSQKPEGNFEYLYDWKQQQYSQQDDAVRQAGAGWGLATIHMFDPSEEVEVALQKALDFMNKRSRRSEEGWRYVVYPGEKLGSTGTGGITRVNIRQDVISCRFRLLTAMDCRLA
jgi:hypothetical protein